MKIRALKVNEVNLYLKQMMGRDPILNRIAIVGELTNFKFHTSGHAYFALKDGDAKINCVWFGAVNDPMSRDLRDGMQLVCQGAVTLYEREGKYQLAVKSVERLGVGDLAEQFEKMKQSLMNLGYFDSKFKKQIPKYPNRVAIITSPTGAVIRDLLTVSGRRNPNVEVIVIPTAVQGVDAPDQIAAALSRANALKLADVIILARGGGSMEELWAFNAETVAHQIFKSEIPIVSAVGHETDFTIADFVADLRAATPSEAAELVFPDLSNLREQNDMILYKITTAMNKKLKDVKNQLSLHNPKREYGKIKANLSRREESLLQEFTRAKQALINRIHTEKAALEHQGEQLETLSPLKTLTRGYSVVLNSKGMSIRSAEQLKVGESLEIKLMDGTVHADVTQISLELGEHNG